MERTFRALNIRSGDYHPDNPINIMKTKLSVLIGLLVVCAPSANGQGTFTYDQQSAIEGQFGELPYNISSQAPGQGFTPSLDGVNFIRLYLSDGFPGDTKLTQLFLNLRQGSITGPIIGTSGLISLNGYFASTSGDFSFPSAIPLVPGTTYYFDVNMVTGGSPTWEVSASRLFNYPSGTAYSQGVAASGIDLWFP